MERLLTLWQLSSLYYLAAVSILEVGSLSTLQWLLLEHSLESEILGSEHLTILAGSLATNDSSLSSLDPHTQLFIVFSQFSVLHHVFLYFCLLSFYPDHFETVHCLSRYQRATTPTGR